LSGNEDAGQMSAWLVCSMIGFYPVCPGKPEYVIGATAFDEVQIKSGSKAKPFVIKAIRNNSKQQDFENITLNGLPVKGSIIKHQQVVEGGELIFKTIN